MYVMNDNIMKYNELHVNLDEKLKSFATEKFLSFLSAQEKKEA